MPNNITYNVNYNRRRYGFWNAAVDMFMLLITGGLWIIWIIARYLRTH